MIYLVTVHDRKKRISHIDNEKDLKTNVWKSILKLTTHKSILYPLTTFNTFNNVAIPNRVNIVYAKKIEKDKKLPNVLVTNEYNKIIQAFKEATDDLFIIGTSRGIVETFAKDADFIIDYTTEELGFTMVSIFDTINFADYTLIKKRDYDHYTLRYFVREKSNFIGY